MEITRNRLTRRKNEMEHKWRAHAGGPTQAGWRTVLKQQQIPETRNQTLPETKQKKQKPRTTRNQKPETSRNQTLA